MSFTASPADATTLSIMAPEDIRSVVSGLRCAVRGRRTSAHVGGWRSPAYRKPRTAHRSVRMRVIVIMRVVMIVIVRMRMSGHAGLHLIDHLPRQLFEGEGGGGGRIRGNDRVAGVAAYYHLRVDWHFAEEGDAEHFGGLASAAVTEDLFALATVAADEVTHVLDDAEDRNVDLAEHR